MKTISKKKKKELFLGVEQVQYPFILTLWTVKPGEISILFIYCAY